MFDVRRARLVIASIGLLWGVQAFAQDDTLTDYCHQRAREFSGYEGPVPEKKGRDEALEGAARGAGLATIASVVKGESSSERRVSQARGALFGGLVGVIRGSEQRQIAERKARIYRLEFDACIRANR